jgi:hypothetical protein
MTGLVPNPQGNKLTRTNDGSNQFIEATGLLHQKHLRSMLRIIEVGYRRNLHTHSATTMHDVILMQILRDWLYRPMLVTPVR